MTPEELDALQARAEAWHRAYVLTGGAPDRDVLGNGMLALVAEVRRLQALVSPFALAGVEPTDGSAIRELRAEVARLTRELAEEREERRTQAAVVVKMALQLDDVIRERDEADAQVRRLSEPYATPLELLQPETPMEQANVEPARPVHPGRWTTGWENPRGLVWWFVRGSDGVRRARSFPLLDGTFGWDIPVVIGETYPTDATGAPIWPGESGYPTLQEAQRAAEEWLAKNGGGA